MNETFSVWRTRVLERHPDARIHATIIETIPPLQGNAIAVVDGFKVDEWHAHQHESELASKF